MGIENILLNPETIAVNQDPWGLPAFRVATPEKCSGEQWVRPLANGDIAALILNRYDNVTIETRLDLSALEQRIKNHYDTNKSTSDTITDPKEIRFIKYSVRDIQGRKNLG